MQKRIIAVVIAAALSGNAFANDSSELEKLRALVQELDQRIRVLDRKNELAEEASAAKKKETPIVNVGEKGFGLQSADGQFALKLRGVLQADYRSFGRGANDVRNRSDARGGNLNPVTGFHDANDTWLGRRIRPIVEGTVLGKYDFRITPDFANGSAAVQDAYIDARLDPAFKVRIGKYKPFVGLERLQGATDIKFVERSYVSNNILPNRDLGISAYGDVFDSKLNYALGLNNGVVDGGNTSTGAEWNGNKEFTGRLFATPFKDSNTLLAGLGFGLGATYTNATGEKNLNFTDTTAADGTRNGLPAYVTESQQVFFRYSPAAIADGKRFRFTPQANYYAGSLGIIAEYARVEQGVSLAGGGSPAAGGAVTTVPSVLPGSKKTLRHNAWEIAASYLLTGEDASSKGVKPKQYFDLDKGGRGAWELVGRYSEMNLDANTFNNSSGILAKQTSADTVPTLAEAYADPTFSAKKAKTWTVGVNWYLNQNAKVVLNYAQTSFDGGAASGAAFTGATSNSYNAATNRVANRPDERALLARFQIAF